MFLSQKERREGVLSGPCRAPLGLRVASEEPPGRLHPRSGRGLNPRCPSHFQGWTPWGSVEGHRASSPHVHTHAHKFWSRGQRPPSDDLDRKPDPSPCAPAAPRPGSPCPRCVFLPVQEAGLARSRGWLDVLRRVTLPTHLRPCSPGTQPPATAAPRGDPGSRHCPLHGPLVGACLPSANPQGEAHF